jgi:hypothetical protein
MDTEERRELGRVCQQLAFVPGPLHAEPRVRGPTWNLRPIWSLASSWPGIPPFTYSRGELAAAYGEARQTEQQGRLAHAALAWTVVFRFHTARGEFADARAARQRLPSLLERVPDTSFVYNHCTAAEDEWRMARDEDWDQPMFGARTPDTDVSIVKFHGAPTDAAVARTHARMGRAERALRRLGRVVNAIERAPGWAENYVRMICDAAETLWLTERTDFAGVVERNLRAKIVIE